jgi:hypothetical protein
VFLHGLMAGDTKAITLMTKKRVKEFSIGLMEESTKEVGKTENNTELEPTPLLAVKQNKENGKKEKDFTGYRINEHFKLFIIYFTF